MKIEFVIPGVPVPKARAIVTKRGAFTPQKTAVYEKAVRVQALIALHRPGVLHPWPLDVEYGIECRFYVTRPVLKSGKKGKKKRMDGDNVLKSVQDGLEGVLYKNDNQVVSGHYWMYRDALSDRTEVTVWVEELD